MNPEQNRRECVVCRESERSFIHAVSKIGVIRLLCTDCLLKEHRELFCPVCFELFGVDSPPPQACIVCRNCPSTTHLSCSPSPPSSSTALRRVGLRRPPSFTCPPCSDPNFIFFPKSRENEDVSETPLDMNSANALVAAAKISVASIKNAATQLRKEATEKITVALIAKSRARKAMENLQDLVLRQIASEDKTTGKRKLDHR